MSLLPLIFTSFPFSSLFFFFFNDTATTEIYTLSLHDALPILSFSRAISETARRESLLCRLLSSPARTARSAWVSLALLAGDDRDRKSTRLNSSHQIISYAVFCLKKKEHTSELQSPDHIVCRLL